MQNEKNKRVLTYSGTERLFVPKSSPDTKKKMKVLKDEKM